MKTIITPLNSLQAPWHIAIARRAFVTWATLPVIWSEAFFTKWAEVYRPFVMRPKTGSSS